MLRQAIKLTQTDDDVIKKKHQTNNFAQNSRAQTSSDFSIGRFAQRKASCACGGGCPRCQTEHSLPVSKPNDSSEIEADNIADKIMRMPANQSLSKSLYETTASIVQPKHEGTSSTISNEVRSRATSSQGNMDNDTQSFMQSRFGADFSNVKIHTDNEAVRMSRELNAKAFTKGNDIYFNEGQYQPDSESGKHLLAHELAHVVQQNNGHAVGIQRMAACPSSLKASDSVPKGWKVYNGNPSVFHCGYRGILEDRTPTTTDPQNECFYDETGKLVDDKHPYSGCKGTPNSYDSASDPLSHTFLDPGGIMSAGWEAFWESRRHDLKGFGGIVDMAEGLYELGAGIGRAGSEVKKAIEDAGQIYDAAKDAGKSVSDLVDTVEDLGEAGKDFLKLFELGDMSF